MTHIHISGTRFWLCCTSQTPSRISKPLEFTLLVSMYHRDQRPGVHAGHARERISRARANAYVPSANDIAGVEPGVCTSTAERRGVEGREGEETQEEVKSLSERGLGWIKKGLE